MKNCPKFNDAFIYSDPRLSNDKYLVISFEYVRELEYTDLCLRENLIHLYVFS